MTPQIHAKLSQLQQLLTGYSKVAIGFSGGVDSTFLAAVCERIMPQRTLLVHLSTPLIGTPEQDSFRRAVRAYDDEPKDIQSADDRPRFNLPVLNLSISQLESPDVVANDRDRCYHCKKLGFTQIVNHARALGFPIVIDGSNASDAGDYRPGMRAVEELGVRSPLMEVGFTKDEEREVLREWGYPVWNMPAGACLATRIPTGEPLTQAKVDLVRACEDHLHGLGLSQVRARLMDGTMHIEAAPDDLARLSALGAAAPHADGSIDMPATVAEKLRALGCAQVSPQVKPYIHGNMNEGSAALA